jgi:L-ascorbate metabolism protein UlaG (beta-lactamase superfamily)
MPRNRRTFLKYVAGGSAVVTGGTACWLAVSKQRAARWARRLIQDAQRQIEPAPALPNPAEWSDRNITMSWLGHSTVLINFYGLHILTDPALGNRVGISLGVGIAGPKRYVFPALRVNELPCIDVLLLSHAHMDHLDLPTLRRIPRGTWTATAKATSDLLDARRLKFTELSWGDRTMYRGPKGELEVEAIEVKHWGQRWPSEKPRGYNGYIIRREGKALLFAGDTALTPALGDVRSRGRFAAAMMPIGAYQPWIWNHCTPEQALTMANAAGADYILPVHHQTFRLSDEPRNEPIERLEKALKHEPERLAWRRIGETFVCKV